MASTFWLHSRSDICTTEHYLYVPIFLPIVCLIIHFDCDVFSCKTIPLTQKGARVTGWALGLLRTTSLDTSLHQRATPSATLVFQFKKMSLYPCHSHSLSIVHAYLPCAVFGRGMLCAVFRGGRVWLVWLGLGFELERVIEGWLQGLMGTCCYWKRGKEKGGRKGKREGEGGGWEVSEASQGGYTRSHSLKVILYGGYRRLHTFHFTSSRFANSNNSSYCLCLNIQH